eukprot:3469499-Rhodomonas_salina.1
MHTVMSRYAWGPGKPETVRGGTSLWKEVREKRSERRTPRRRRGERVNTRTRRTMTSQNEQKGRKQGREQNVPCPWQREEEGRPAAAPVGLVTAYTTSVLGRLYRARRQIPHRREAAYTTSVPDISSRASR